MSILTSLLSSHTVQWFHQQHGSSPLGVRSVGPFWGDLFCEHSLLVQGCHQMLVSVVLLPQFHSLLWQLKNGKIKNMKFINIIHCTDILMKLINDFLTIKMKLKWQWTSSYHAFSSSFSSFPWILFRFPHQHPGLHFQPDPWWNKKY